MSSFFQRAIFVSYRLRPHLARLPLDPPRVSLPDRLGLLRSQDRLLELQVSGLGVENRCVRTEQEMFVAHLRHERFQAGQSFERGNVDPDPLGRKQPFERLAVAIAERIQQDDPRPGARATKPISGAGSTVGRPFKSGCSVRSSSILSAIWTISPRRAASPSSSAKGGSLRV